MPRELLCPADEAALIARIIDAGQEVRAAGSRTSKSPCFRTRGLEIRLDHFEHIEVEASGRVRVGAGATLNALLAALQTHQLALPTIGEWHGQTMGGAISTGTHGGSYRVGSLLTSVQALTLVDGNGEVRRLERGDPGFSHVLPSFGTTGVVLEYELACVPAFQLALRRSLRPFDAFLARLLSPGDGEFRSALWMPALDHVVDYEARRVDAPPPGARPEREPRFNNTAMILDWVVKHAANGLDRLPGARPARRVGRVGAGWLARRLLPGRDYAGAYDIMLAPLSSDAEAILQKRARNRTPPEGEFALGYEAAEALIRTLHAHFRRTGHYPDRPVGLRPGAAEPGTLAAAQGAPCIWVSLFLDPENPLMRVLPDLLVEHGARPHWGKCVFHRPGDVAGLYSGWENFRAFRDASDPRRLFINPFAESLGL